MLLVSLFVATCAVLGAPVSASAATAGPVTATNGLKLTITQLNPRQVVSTTSNVAVTGTVTNISDRRIDNIKVRLQLGSPVTGEAQLNAALAGTLPADQTVTTYQPVTDSLAPGQSASLSALAPVQGGPGSLQISQPGVYPMLVNVQGQPAYGGQARLAAANLLLPVASAPGGAAPGKPASPAQLTLLWPLVDDQPRVIGASNGQAVLSDDTLADSLVSGGRLFGLVQAVKDASAANPALLTSMCFAIDPDLLTTVGDMAGGYQVSTATGLRPGAGATAAAEWLNMLGHLTAGHCVIALPYADADLVALTRAGGVPLAAQALTGGSEIASALPGTTPLSGVVWPVDGALDQATALALGGPGMNPAVNTVLLSPGSVAGSAGTAESIEGVTRPHALLIDQQASAALSSTANPSNVDTSAVSTEAGIAAWTYQTLFAGTGGQATLIAPPRRWNATQADLEQYLSTLAGSLNNQAAEPVSLATLAAQPATGSVRLTYPAAAAAAEIPATVTGRVVADDVAQQDLLGAMNQDHANPVPPARLVAPLRVGLLHAVSTAWRADPSGATDTLDMVEQQFTRMLGAVTVVSPNQIYSLGSQSSRLPVAVANNLPVDITVDVDLLAQSGLSPARVEDKVILAGTSQTFYLPVKLSRSGRFSVQVSVTTPGGIKLGDTARYEVVSGAYGTIILIITVVAFAVLVLLSGRRIFRRLRRAREATNDELDLPTVPGEPTVPNVPAQEPVDH